MDLYTYEEVERAFVSDESDEDFEVEEFEVGVKRGRRMSRGRVSARKNQSQPIAKMKGKIESLDLDAEEDSLEASASQSVNSNSRRILEEAKRLLDKKPTAVVAQLDTAIPSKADNHDEVFKRLLAKSKLLQQNLFNISERENAIANAIEREKNENLHSVVIPVIAKSQPRTMAAPSNVKLDLIVSQEPTAVSIQLKTRLDRCERIWECHPDVQFKELKLRFAETFGIDLVDIIFTFDGEALKDSDTPRSLGMENEDLIDVRVPKNKVESAIQHAQNFKENKEKAVVESQPQIIQVKTRLAQHEIEWKIGKSALVSDLKAMVVKAYGLSPKGLSLRLRGSCLRDPSSVNEQRIQDGDVIEIVIPKTRVATAIRFASKNVVGDAHATSAPPPPVSDRSIAQAPQNRELIDISVIIPAEMSTDSSNDCRIDIKAYNDFTLRQIYGAVIPLVRLSSFSLRTDSDEKELDIKSQLVELGIKGGGILRVRPSSVLEVFVCIGDEKVTVKVPRFQACGPMMHRIAAALEMDVSILEFTYDGKVISEQNLFCDFDMQSGSTIFLNEKKSSNS